MNKIIQKRQKTISTEQQSRLLSLVHELFSSCLLFSVGRFAPGDYAMAYDNNGRLTADGTRGVTSVSYHPWLNLPLLIKFDSGDWSRSDYWPDGTLRSRFTQTRRIDPVSATNLNTNLTAETSEPMAVSPNLRTTRRYRGSFEIVSGAESYARVNTSTGYYDCKEKRHYYFLTNRQGSVMVVIDDHGTTVQRTGLYPSGTPLILPSDYGKFIANSTQTLTPTTDRLHIGNRWLGHSGLNRYDNTARLHDPLLLRFDTPDPLATKFPALNPWTHTAANPANAIDPDGLSVWELDSRGFFTLKEETDDDFDTILGQNNTSINIEKGFLNSEYTAKGINEGTLFDVSIFHLSKNGKQLFEFLADNSEVEWPRVKLTTGDEYIGTSYDKDQDGSVKVIEEKMPEDYRRIYLFDHNHPNNVATASPADRKRATEISESSDIPIIFRIYITKEVYQGYKGTIGPVPLYLHYRHFFPYNDL